MPHPPYAVKAKIPIHAIDELGRSDIAKVLLFLLGSFRHQHCTEGKNQNRYASWRVIPLFRTVRILGQVHLKASTGAVKILDVRLFLPGQAKQFACVQ